MRSSWLHLWHSLYHHRRYCPLIQHNGSVSFTSTALAAVNSMNSTKHTGWYTTPIGGPQTRTIHIILESIKFHPNLEEHLEKILNREDLPSAHSIAVSSDYSQRFDPKTQFAMNSVVLALKETHHPPLRKFIFHGLDTRLSINLFSGQIAPYLTMLMLSHVSLDTARSPLLRMGSLLILKISHSVVWNNLADMFSVLGALPLLECLDLQHVRLQELPNEYVAPKPKPNLARLQRLTFVDHSARSATWVRDVLLGLAFPSTVELYIEHDLRNDPVDGVSRQLSWAAPRAVPRLVDFSTLTIHLYKELRDDVKVRLNDGCSIVASSARWTEAAQADGSDPWLPKLFSYSLPPAHMTRLESDRDFFAMSAVQSLAK
ncbi:hypothetical protein FA95DRAFT_1220484 [Auriscalpium vulgare]|uniref:Uncharacterized protein n=1 Tax=Auriscalpium vulgare TaxID=40419 RepID=A0ACB8RUS2_9AGAM|nr:hypothetical protein FA95DRAFT_1220484 [Auriscalpium vulgare]